MEDCERKCGTPQKRRRHLIDKHRYPRNYFFAVTKVGIDGRRSLLTDGHARRRSSTTNSAKETHKDESAGAGQKLERNDTDPRPLAGEKADNTESQPQVGNDEKMDDGGHPDETVKEKKAQEPERQQPDTEMEDLAGAMSSLRFVPTTIRFGRGKGRSGFSRS